MSPGEADVTSCGSRPLPAREAASVRLPVMLAFALLSIVPTAEAAVAVGPFSSLLRHEESISFDGRLEARADAGIVDFSPLLEEGGSLEVTWPYADGYVETRFSYAAGSGPTRVQNGAWSQELVYLAEGSLRVTDCRSPCTVTMRTRDDLRDRVDSMGIEIQGHAERAHASWTDKQLRWEPPIPYATIAGEELGGFVVDLSPYWLLVAGADDPGGLRLADATLHAFGYLEFYFWNVTVETSTVDGQRAFMTGFTQTPRAGDIVQYTEGEFLALAIRGANVTTAPGEPFLLGSPRLFLTVDGTVGVERAHGWLRHVERRWDVENESLDVSGVVNAELWYEPPPEGRTERAAANVKGSGSPGLRSRLEGDAIAMEIGDAAVLSPILPQATIMAALIMAIMLAASLLSRAGWFPLFSRVGPSSALRHPRRAQIVALLRSEPGATSSGLARAMGVSRQTVEHHLRVLVRTGWVVEHASGRSVHHFESDGLVDVPLREARVALAAAGRAAVARALAQAEAPRTQAELEASLGLQQRLVSYHLARLERSGLVEAIKGRPRRYAPTRLLREILDASDPPALEAGAGADRRA